MKRFVLRFVPLLVLCSVLVSLPKINIVKASGTIYIKADGSVDPITLPIQRDGNVYTFTDDIFDSIVVEKDGVIIDGADYTLQGTGSGKGIYTTRSNVRIQNVEINEFNDDISLFGGSNNTIIGNNITTSNQWGIRLAGSSNNSVSGNTITANRYGGIVVMTSDNNSISGNIITNNFRGLDFTASENNIVSGNYIANNNDGIALENMYNSIIRNTIINNSDKGIILYGAGLNNIIGNNLTNNVYGIWFSVCSNNVIYHNNFVNNTIHAHTDGSNGIWDNGFEGNYWDDYTGVDNDDDGIGDTPYVINENNQDRYPLMNPVVIPEFPDTTPHTSESFPTTWIVAAIAIIAVVGAALLVYFAKVKKTTGKVE